MGSLNRLTVWLLLLAFALPSAGGRGLHWLLPKQGQHQDCCCPGEAGHLFHTSGGKPYSDFCCFVEKTYTQGGHEHQDNRVCRDGCFLCRYLTRLQPSLDFGLETFGIERIGTAVIWLPAPVGETPAVLHAGRSPPCFSLC